MLSLLEEKCLVFYSLEKNGWPIAFTSWLLLGKQKNKQMNQNLERQHEHLEQKSKTNAAPEYSNKNAHF